MLRASLVPLGGPRGSRSSKPISGLDTMESRHEPRTHNDPIRTGSESGALQAANQRCTWDVDPPHITPHRAIREMGSPRLTNCDAQLNQAKWADSLPQWMSRTC